MSDAFDVCVIGSGAGGAPVAATLAEAGYRVVVLEKGPWYDRTQFFKDEVSQCRRASFVPTPMDEPMVREYRDMQDRQILRKTEYADSLWNGCLVGGASVLMSGFMLRLKPEDFRMRSTYGAIPGTTLADWPISYDDLEPYYAKAEQEVGIAGMVLDDDELAPGTADKRSTEEMPFGPVNEHPLADLIDGKLGKAGLHPLPMPRAVLPEPIGRERQECGYAGYCGSYGCRTGAKGSALSVFIPRVVKRKGCEVRSRAKVTRLVSDQSGKVRKAEYIDRVGRLRTIEAGIFVVACQAIESARLLLNSRGPRHPNGLANGSGLVGRNLISSTFGACWGEFPYRNYRDDTWLRSKEPFVNRAIQDWYFINDARLGRRKGGTHNFLLMHPNPVSAAIGQALYDRVPTDNVAPGMPIWGPPLKEKLRAYFQDAVHLKVENFGEWLPTPGGRVTLDDSVRDRWGIPVSRVLFWTHRQNRETAKYMVDRGIEMLRLLGAENPRGPSPDGGPSTNLVGGTCRFGTSPATSVLDPDCRAHEASNLFVSDGSFMPTGGSVPYTFTIYANALRVADKIVKQLRSPREG